MKQPVTTSSVSEVCLADFPVVYMSYDEPWAEENWKKLVAKRPNAVRVEGVKGLNACHVAAAEAAGTPWFLTVDADTVIEGDLSDVYFSEAFLNPNFRLDWRSLNAVNGVLTGNGSLKLWSRKLVLSMKSHEKAPEQKISIDADIDGIFEGRSKIVLMPACVSSTNPARTPQHAFRAGFREACFLSWLRRGMLLAGSDDVTPLERLLVSWCILGNHAENGIWMLYGARMGLWAEHTWSGWDIRSVNDFNWFRGFWNDFILPRIGTGGTRCAVTGLCWDQDRLVEEYSALGDMLSEVTELPIDDVHPALSRTMVESHLFPAHRAVANLNIIGRIFQKGNGCPIDLGVAERLYEDAAILQDATACTNLARLHQLGLAKQPDLSVAEHFLNRGVKLGCAYAPYHLASLITSLDGTTEDRKAEAEALIDLSAERGFAPEDDKS